MDKKELTKKAEKDGFINNKGHNEPTWFSDMNDNLNLIVYLLSKNSIK